MGIVETERVVSSGMTILMCCADTSVSVGVLLQEMSGSDRVSWSRRRQRLRSSRIVWRWKSPGSDHVLRRVSTAANKFLAMVSILATWILYFVITSVPGVTSYEVLTSSDFSI